MKREKTCIKTVVYMIVKNIKHCPLEGDLNKIKWGRLKIRRSLVDERSTVNHVKIL